MTILFLSHHQASLHDRTYADGTKKANILVSYAHLRN